MQKNRDVADFITLQILVRAEIAIRTTYRITMQITFSVTDSGMRERGVAMIMCGLSKSKSEENVL